MIRLKDSLRKLNELNVKLNQKLLPFANKVALVTKDYVDMLLPPLPASVAQLSIEDSARQVLTWLDDGRFGEVRAVFDFTMKMALTEKKLAQIWLGLASKMGDFQSQGEVRQHDHKGFTVVLVTCEFELDTVDLQLTFDKSRRLAGFHVRPLKRKEREGRKRPQTPEGPFPYSAREVLYRSRYDNSNIGGTLTIPPGDGPHPAALLITGSGSQDRDETIFDHKPFLVIADQLSRNGFAVLRVDDRGVGKTTGDPRKSTIQIHAADARSGVDFLKRQPEIDGRKIGLIGHSEGGVIAPLVAAEPDADLAFIVSLAGSAIPGGELTALQVEALLKAKGELTDSAIADLVALQRRAMAVVRRGGDEKAIRAAVDDALLAGLKHAPAEDRRKATPLMLEAKAEAEAAALASPWYRSFVKLDPCVAWRRVRCPVLALNGDKDRQVPADINLNAIEKALAAAGNKDVTIHKLGGLNHMFQNADSGLVSEYAVIEETFDAAALELMTRWLRQRAALDL